MYQAATAYRNHPARAAAGQAARAVRGRAHHRRQTGAPRTGAAGFEGSQIAILDALLKLRQVCCDPRLVKGTTKTAHTMERASSNCWPTCCPPWSMKAAACWCSRSSPEMLALDGRDARHPGPALPHPHRPDPPRERGAVVKRFQAQDETSAPILLASLKAGGVGLNLTAADTVIHLDPGGTLRWKSRPPPRPPHRARPARVRLLQAGGGRQRRRTHAGAAGAQGRAGPWACWATMPRAR